MNLKLDKNKEIGWSQKKNEQLKIRRNISFEIIKDKIIRNNILEIRKHPNKIDYPHQKQIIVKYKNYIYVVPFVEDNKKYFLKTIYPSRVETKNFLNK